MLLCLCLIGLAGGVCSYGLLTEFCCGDCPALPCDPHCLNVLVISLVFQQAYNVTSVHSVMGMVFLSVIPGLIQISELTVKTTKYQQPMSVV